MKTNFLAVEQQNVSWIKIFLMKRKVNRIYQGSKFGTLYSNHELELVRRTHRKRVLHVSLVDLKIESVAIGRFEFRMVCESVIGLVHPYVTACKSCCYEMHLRKWRPALSLMRLVCYAELIVSFLLLLVSHSRITNCC